MIEVYPNLYVGDEQDYEHMVKGRDGWTVVHACKEPYHRAELGYTGRGAPKDHPEYLIARRGHRLILNLVDAPDPRFIPKEIMDAALDFVDGSLRSGCRVLVHCNLGESRAPSIALLYLAAFTTVIPSPSFAEAESAFRLLYPAYNPSPGIRGFLKENWQVYCGKESETS